MTVDTEPLPRKAADPAAFTRLHVAPLDAELLKLIIPAAILPRARNISFHTIQTLPENRFGFVDLPCADAEKLKKKLNGAVLRGLKIRIGAAKVDDMPKPNEEAALAGPSTTKEKKSKKHSESKKKRKRDSEEEITGVVLEEGRKVKRGWTVPEETRKKKDKGKKKDKKGRKEVKSKYTDGAECLVKTVLPAAASTSTEKLDKKAKQKKDKAREVVVHEFENTTKFPTFLKPSSAPSGSSANLEFVDGKGWVDDSGKVVEAVQSRSTTTAVREVQPADEETTSDSGTSSEGEQETGSEAESESDGETSIEKEEEMRSPSRLPKQEGSGSKGLPLDSPRPKSSGSSRSLTIKIPPPATPAPGKVHPLEALYKRVKKGESTPGGSEPKSETKGFSFFGGEDESEALSSQPGPPMTPYTREEFEWRRERSAAPTPDTAHPNKTFKLWPPEGDIEEEDEEEGDEEADDEEMADAQAVRPSTEGKGEDQAETSDFQKWFWENRGDLNRSWKKRRKTAAKEKRYRENRARAERAI